MNPSCNYERFTVVGGIEFVTLEMQPYLTTPRTLLKSVLTEPFLHAELFEPLSRFWAMYIE
jgi:hypothetical protein